MNSPDDMYREDTELTKHYLDRKHYYLDMVMGQGDYIREIDPTTLQIKILKPKKETE